MTMCARGTPPTGRNCWDNTSGDWLNRGKGFGRRDEHQADHHFGTHPTLDTALQDSSAMVSGSGILRNMSRIECMTLPGDGTANKMEEIALA